MDALRFRISKLRPLKYTKCISSDCLGDHSPSSFVLTSSYILLSESGSAAAVAAAAAAAAAEEGRSGTPPPRKPGTPEGTWKGQA